MSQLALNQEKKIYQVWVPLTNKEGIKIFQENSIKIVNSDTFTNAPSQFLPLRHFSLIIIYIYFLSKQTCTKVHSTTTTQ